MKKIAPSVGFLALGMLIGKRMKSSKTAGSKNINMNPQVRVINSPLPRMKDNIATVDRWLNKLNAIPKEQRLVMEKAMRQLPTDHKGRVSRQQLEALFTGGNIPYMVDVLMDKTSDLGASRWNSTQAINENLNSLLDIIYGLTGSATQGEREILRHRVEGLITNFLNDGVRVYEQEPTPQQLEKDIEGLALDIKMAIVEPAINNPGMHRHIQEVQEKILPSLKIPLRRLIASIDTNSYMASKTVYAGDYGLSSHKLNVPNVSVEVEALVRPKIKGLFAEESFSFTLGFTIASHYKTSAKDIMQGKSAPLFWFRGGVIGDTLYVTELQNDWASDYRKPIFDEQVGADWGNPFTRLPELQEKEQRLKRTKYRYDMKSEDATWWNWDKNTAEDIEEYIQDDIDAGEISTKQQIEAARKEYSQPYKDEIWQMGGGIPKRFSFPPTDWVRSDILLAFAVAANMGLSKVGFCSSVVPLATVGGDPKGQKDFYDSIVPKRVKSVAKQYNIAGPVIKTIGTAEVPIPFDSFTAHAGTKRGTLTRDVTAHVWTMPPQVIKFFREKGYPLFG